MASGTGRARWQPASLALVATLVAGCGGTGGAAAVHPGVAPSRPAAASSPAGARFIAAADTICRRLDGELSNPKPGAITTAVLATTAPLHAALERGAVRDLSRLRPPASLASDWRTILGYRRALAEDLAKLAAPAKAHDRRALRALLHTKAQVRKALLAAAGHDGFRECSTIATRAALAGARAQGGPGRAQGGGAAAKQAVGSAAGNLFGP